MVDWMITVPIWNLDYERHWKVIILEKTLLKTVEKRRRNTSWSVAPAADDGHGWIVEEAPRTLVAMKNMRHEEEESDAVQASLDFYLFYLISY